MNPSIPGNPDAPGNALTVRGRARAIAWGAAALAGILGALASPPGAAVGLGPITQQSSLGAPLRVVVPVLLAGAEEIASECFRLAPAQSDADGIPQVLFGRVAVERMASGMQLVVTSARPMNDPVAKLTLQAGCETSMRREYTLLMDPPAIEPPIVAAEAAPREVVAAPRAPSAARAGARTAQSRARTTVRGAPSRGSGESTGKARKAPPPKSRGAAKAAPKRPPAVAASRPRLTVSSAAPGFGVATAGAAAEAERERAQQELANSIEAETLALRQRIVELTAMVERMQQEVKAQEEAQRATDQAAQRASAAAAKAPPRAPESAWWDDSVALLAAIVGLPLAIAAGLLWKRRRDAARASTWRAAPAPTRSPTPARTPAPKRAAAPRAESAPEAPAARPLRNAPAGLAAAEPEIPEAPFEPVLEKVEEAGDALGVSDLAQVTEEARVYVALGHHERAIEVLNEHIRQAPRSMPAAWLMLLDLYLATGRRQDFRALAEEFHLQFNVETPTWEGFAPDASGGGGLDAFPHVVRKVAELWREPGCRAYLERLLNDNRDGRRVGFPLPAYADILFLLQILDAPEPVDIDLDLVDDGKLDLAPRAAAAPAPSPPRAAPASEPARLRKPMPPDPSASARPMQQPIEFEVDPDTFVRPPGRAPKS